MCGYVDVSSIGHSPSGNCYASGNNNPKPSFADSGYDDCDEGVELHLDAERPEVRVVAVQMAWEIIFNESCRPEQSIRIEAENSEHDEDISVGKREDTRAASDEKLAHIVIAQ